MVIALALTLATVAVVTANLWAVAPILAVAWLAQPGR